MENFIDNNIDDIVCEYLLEANPFHKDSRINFLGRLTPEMFFEDFYVQSIDISEDSLDKDVIQFTSNFNQTLSETKENRFAKVDLIHIEGYAGCGKTTFIRYILWSKFKDYDLQRVIDFSGEHRIIDAYISALAKLIYVNFYEKGSLTWNDIDDLNLFETRRFGNTVKELLLLREDIKSLENYNNGIDKLKIENLLFSNETYSSLRFLLRAYFLLQLLECVASQRSQPLIMVFDNVDSIDNTEEEQEFVFALRDFIIDCNYFFGFNRFNDNKVHQTPISNIVINFKMICFLTTRIITFKRIIEMAPDIEELFGWKSFKLPENYFNHLAIINKKIDYYLNDKKLTGTNKHEELREIKRFAQALYKSNIISRLFNGNIRFSIKTLCNIIKLYSNTNLLYEANQLFSLKTPHNDNIDGANGIIISLILNYFKGNNIYKNKLHLSNCLQDNEISLSRIILTIIREKFGSCSLVDIFDCLYNIFSLDEICEIVYDMCESNRDVWRRLIVFSKNYPQNGLKDLILQKEYYEKGERTTDKFSVIELCAAGYVYLETIVPHFEFMLSRHSEYDFTKNVNYHPLFSKSSEDIIGNATDEMRYRFERKIEWVYGDVKDCCKNTRFMANKIMDENNWDEDMFLNYSVYNYRSVYSDGTMGYKQGYTSRLIFSHIGYIERYRRYLLLKYSFFPLETKIDINKRLVQRIKKFLELYLDSSSEESKCCKSQRQNEAALILFQCIDKIEHSNFKDFSTLIEVLR